MMPRECGSWVLMVVLAVTVLALGSSAQGQDNARLDALERQLTELKAEIAELKKQAAGGAMTPARRAEIEKIIKGIEKDTAEGKFRDWLENLDVHADLRLRYRTRKRGRTHADRGEFRLRVGMRKTWWDGQMEAGFRLATGATTGATSTNQPFDNNASEKSVWIDRAYAKYEPENLKGFRAVGGKMANPLVSTDMVWDSDVNPEGVFVIYKRKEENESLRPFAGAGYFQMTVPGTTRHVGRLFAYQGGAEFEVVEDVKVTAAATWYDWQRYETNFTAAGGNTVNPAGTRLTAEEFDVLDAIGKVSWKLYELPFTAFVDYARNCSDEVGKDDDAMSAGLKVGKSKEKGDWSAKYRYAHIDANAVPGGLSDGDFMGTNRKGHQVTGGYMISDFLKFETTVTSNESVSGPTARQLQLVFDLIWSW